MISQQFTCARINSPLIGGYSTHAVAAISRLRTATLLGVTLLPAKVAPPS